MYVLYILPYRRTPDSKCGLISPETLWFFFSHSVHSNVPVSCSVSIWTDISHVGQLHAIRRSGVPLGLSYMTDAVRFSSNFIFWKSSSRIWGPLSNESESAITKTASSQSARLSALLLSSSHESLLRFLPRIDQHVLHLRHGHSWFSSVVYRNTLGIGVVMNSGVSLRILCIMLATKVKIVNTTFRDLSSFLFKVRSYKTNNNTKVFGRIFNNEKAKEFKIGLIILKNGSHSYKCDTPNAIQTTLCFFFNWLFCSFVCIVWN